MIGYILILAVITMFDWLNDVNNLRNNAFAQSATLNKTGFNFQLFDALYLLKSRSGGGVVDNTLHYQSRDRKIDPPLLWSFG